jgi:uncharacterized DUF497 family protein
MEFDWTNRPETQGVKIPESEIEESFEDPFAIRLLPDDLQGSPARYFILGKSVSGRGLFSVFWTDGKVYRVIASRDMTPEEAAFYERKNSELMN